MGSLRIKDSRARSFVMIMIVIAVSALLLRLAIDALIKMSIAQNESNAQGTIKLIAASLEKYAEDNNGVYPADFSLLTQTSPSYLDIDYTGQSPIKGYNYGCSRLESSGYSCFAAPAICSLTGRLVFTITTGRLLVSEACDKKE